MSDTMDDETKARAEPLRIAAERKAFEAWHVEAHYGVPIASYEARMRWEGWIARAARQQQEPTR